MRVVLGVCVREERNICLKLYESSLSNVVIHGYIRLNYNHDNNFDDNKSLDTNIHVTQNTITLYTEKNQSKNRQTY